MNDIDQSMSVPLRRREERLLRRAISTSSSKLRGPSKCPLTAQGLPRILNRSACGVERGLIKRKRGEREVMPSLSRIDLLASRYLPLPPEPRPWSRSGGDSMTW